MSRLFPALALAFILGTLAASVNSVNADDSEEVLANDIKAMQGSWKVSHAIGGEKNLFGETPKMFLTLADKKIEFRIIENEMSFSCIRSRPGESFTLANNLPLPKHSEQVSNSIKGDRLIMLTEKSGKGYLASYRVSGDSMTIRYPAGCCSRSGNVITYERVR
jgi:hypothetical protein